MNFNGLKIGKIIHSLKLTNIAPENRPGPKRKLIFQPSIFRGGNVSFREGICLQLGAYFRVHLIAFLLMSFNFHTLFLAVDLI